MANRPFKYQRRSADEWEKRSERTSGFEGIIKDDYKVYRPKKGDNAIRILPPTFENAKHYGIEAWVHYNVGPDRAAVLCLQKMRGKPCPACEERVEAQRIGDEDGARDLKPRNVIITWVLDKNERDIGNPQVWPIPGSVDTDIVKISQDKRSGEVYEIDNHLEGYDVYFDKEGEGLKTRYGGFQLSKKTNEVPQKALNYIEDHPLDDVMKWREYEQIEKLLAGTPSSKRRDDDDRPSRRQDDDDRPSRRARDEDEDRPSRRSRDEDDDRPSRRARDEDDDERPSRSRSRDEEERPRRSRDEDERPSRRARDEDEDEEPRREAARRGRDAEEDDPPPRNSRNGNGGTTRRAGGRDEEEESRPARRRLNREEDEEEGLPRRSRSASLREQFDRA